MNFDEARREIDQILAGYQLANGESPVNILPTPVTAGKIYEAWVLCRVLQQLHRDEGYEITLQDASMVRLKSAPGSINPGYAHFHLARRGGEDLEVWTDIEFLTLSASV